jgi:hypothetical protein
MQEFKFPDETTPSEKEAPEFELELEGEESPNIEIVDDTPDADKNRKPLDKTIEEPTEDEMADYSSKVQKRIKELTHARHDERRKAEALAQEKLELERAAKILADENRRLQEYVSVGTNAYIDKSKSLAEVGLNNARAKLKAAMDAGDTDAAIAAQEELLKAQFEIQQVNAFKPVDLQKQANQEYTQPIQQQPSPQLDEKVVSWAEKNAWFENPQHTDMTAFAYGVHNQLVRAYGEGFTKTDDYYRQIDTTMRRAFPDYFGATNTGAGNGESEAPRRASSVVAPARRTSAPQKMKLTVRQQNVAKKLGIPLELYAKKLAEMEKQNG